MTPDDQHRDFGLDVEVIEAFSLGDRTYLATDGEFAVVVDPQRDVDRVLAAAGRLGVRITLVLETHLHNDYVSGGLELSRLTGAEYGVAAADDFPFAHRGLRHGDVITVSPRMSVEVMATPGHTFHHLSYVLATERKPLGVFTGGSLLLGTTGRTDLLGSEHSAGLARQQYASAQRLAETLPDGSHVWPTHGFGSFCSVAPAGAWSPTMGEQKRSNPALTLAESDFVEQALSTLDAFPAYYAHMGVRNSAGPPPLDLRPPARASAAELAQRLERGEWMVDLRSRTAYVQSHLAGTVNLSLEGPMATWLGWLIDWGAPITLLGETSLQVAEAQRELARIGIDQFSAAATGPPQELAMYEEQVRSTATATFNDLAARRSRGDADVVLDVRMNNEVRSAHIADTIHIPLYELESRLAEIPDATVWVHCSGGYRAAVAGSLLERAGRTVVVVDDKLTAAAGSGLPVISR